MAEEIGSRGPESADDTRRDREATSWLVGVALILLGVLFLLQNVGVFVLTGNWWALFIYLGALGSFINAWRAFRRSGGLNSAASGSLTWGLVLTAVASIFFFELPWDTWWPAILVAVGLGILIGYAARPGMR